MSFHTSWLRMRVPPQTRAERASIVPWRERFDSLVAHWLDWLQHNRGRSPRTAGKYGGYLDQLATWCETPPVDPRMQPSMSNPLELTARDLDLYCGLYAHSRGLTPRSRRPLVSAVRGFYAWAKSTRALEEDPSADLAYPKFGRPLPNALTLPEGERMLMAYDIETFVGLRNAAMIAVLLGCGVRVSGLVAMNDSSLLWDRDEDGVEQLTLKVTEKGKKDRLVPVPEEVALLIRAYLGHVDLGAIDRNIDGDRVLWVSTQNSTCGPHEYHGERRRIGIRSVWEMLDRAGEKAKVPKGHRNPHAFRHLYGTELTEDSVPTLEIQGLMGHVNANDTAIYTRLAQRKLRAQVERANPLAKMRAPLLDSLRSIGATQRRARASSAPNPSYKRESGTPPKGRR